jgi:tRNA 2-thiouridine synthesizing protein A
MDQKLEKTGSESSTTFDSPTSRALGELERLHPDSAWDAGDMGCGELVMELRIRLKPTRPGHLLKLTARDPGAVEDLPAWCRLTGHHLVSADHPLYFIRRKED